jgi:hypothetical protein
VGVEKWELHYGQVLHGNKIFSKHKIHEKINHRSLPENGIWMKICGVSYFLKSHYAERR